MLEFYGRSSTETTILFIVTVILALIAILGSGITVTFYWRKPGTVPFLYKLMGLFDVLVGLNAIYFVFLALTVLRDCSTEDYQLREWEDNIRIGINSASEVNNSNCVNNIPALYIGYMGTIVVTRVPLFIAMVMSIVRTINIASPFTRVRKLWIGLLILAWTLAWTGVAAYAGSVPIQHSGYQYLLDGIEVKDSDKDVYLVDPFYRMITNNPSFDRYYTLINGEFLYSHLAGFIFPLSAILITTVIQVFLLWKSSGLTDSDSLQTQVSITVIILAVVSLVIGLPNAIYISMGWSKYNAAHSQYILDRLQLFVYGFVFPVLNSASDPVILVARGSKHLKSVDNKWYKYEFRNFGRFFETQKTEISADFLTHLKSVDNKWYKYEFRNFGRFFETQKTEISADFLTVTLFYYIN
eukprot:sb/3465189/